MSVIFNILFFFANIFMFFLPFISFIYLMKLWVRHDRKKELLHNLELRKAMFFYRNILDESGIRRDEIEISLDRMIHKAILDSMSTEEAVHQIIHNIVPMLETRNIVPTVSCQTKLQNVSSLMSVNPYYQ